MIESGLHTKSASRELFHLDLDGQRNINSENQYDNQHDIDQIKLEFMSKIFYGLLIFLGSGFVVLIFEIIITYHGIIHYQDSNLFKRG